MAKKDNFVDGLDMEIPTAAIAEIRKLGEEVLRRHIETNIYGVDKRGSGTWVHGTTYSRRHALPATVYSYVAGNTVYVTASGAPSTPIRNGASFDSSEPGSFLGLLESGNLGFLTRTSRYAPGFPRPAVSNAQAEVDGSAFQAQIEKILERHMK